MTIPITVRDRERESARKEMERRGNNISLVFVSAIADMNSLLSFLTAVYVGVSFSFQSLSQEVIQFGVAYTLNNLFGDFS